MSWVTPKLNFLSPFVYRYARCISEITAGPVGVGPPSSHNNLNRRAARREDTAESVDRHSECQPFRKTGNGNDAIFPELQISCEGFHALLCLLQFLLSRLPIEPARSPCV